MLVSVEEQLYFQFLHCFSIHFFGLGQQLVPCGSATLKSAYVSFVEILNGTFDFVNKFMMLTPKIMYSCLEGVRNGASLSGYFLATVDSFVLLAWQWGRFVVLCSYPLDVFMTFFSFPTTQTFSFLHVVLFLFMNDLSTAHVWRKIFSFIVSYLYFCSVFILVFLIICSG